MDARTNEGFAVPSVLSLHREEVPRLTQAIVVGSTAGRLDLRSEEAGIG